jgi:hypothetical protein
MRASNQQIVLNELYRRGFRETERDNLWVTMAKTIGYLRIEVDVDAFGNVNGEPLKEFTRRLR